LRGRNRTWVQKRKVKGEVQHGRIVLRSDGKGCDKERGKIIKTGKVVGKPRVHGLRKRRAESAVKRAAKEAGQYRKARKRVALTAGRRAGDIRLSKQQQNRYHLPRGETHGQRDHEKGWKKTEASRSERTRLDNKRQQKKKKRTSPATEGGERD